ncbi:MAG: zinc ribbon domain-containing protein [Planctomycetota bacterium]|nr:zinc ribbon domain-containing protein [Planctomycetota bacterium]
MTKPDLEKMSVHLTCREMDQSVSFYRDKLGFELLEAWPSEENPQWARMVLNGQSIMLGAKGNIKSVEEQCAGDEVAIRYWIRALTAFEENASGVGISVYLEVPNIDDYFEDVKRRGLKTEGEPKSQFYGIREWGVDDMDGYRLMFHTPIQLESCQSCGMPLAEARNGQMYCDLCTNEEGKLRPYEQILEGTIAGYFMGMQKMSREQAEPAAREHLSKMPTWAGKA